MKGKKSSTLTYIVIGTFVLAAIVLISLLFTNKRIERFSNGQAPKATLEYFYMPSCPHCKDFNPTWEELEKTVTQEDVALRLQKCDIAKDNEKAQKYDVNAAPTLLLIMENGDVEEYKGPREVNAIMSFVKDKLQ